MGTHIVIASLGFPLWLWIEHYSNIHYLHHDAYSPGAYRAFSEQYSGYRAE
jgi:hypothetical protein